MNPVHLGIDVGGTASRWVACDASGMAVARGQTSGATGHMFNPVEAERLRLALGAIATDLSAQGLRAKKATIGLTGFGATVAVSVRALLNEFFAVDPDNCTTLDDMTLAYASVFSPGEGHLISAGTGSIGLHIPASGAPVRVGGRGILIDDAGGGSWIALRALDQLFRRQYQQGTFGDASQLAEQLGRQIGSMEWHAVREFVYGSDRGRIGKLSLSVSLAAEQGDALARAVLKEAAQELALLGKALVQRVGRCPIGFVGGVLDLCDIRSEIQSALANHLVVFPQIDAALAAARMQTGLMQEWRAVVA